MSRLPDYLQEKENTMKDEYVKIDVAFDEPFVHNDALAGLFIYGAFSGEIELISDIQDQDGYRRVRYKLANGELREVRLLKSRIGSDKVKAVDKKYRWNGVILKRR